MCLGQMLLPLEYTLGGQRHKNSHRLCMISPLKGVVCCMVCRHDLRLLRDGCDTAVKA